MIVRHATADDLEGVLRLAREFVVSFPLDVHAFRENYPSLLAVQDVHFTVAEQDGVVVGYLLGNVHLTVYANGLVGWVDEIMVDSNFRRHRIGKALLDDFEQWAAGKGAKLVSLATSRAAPFYLALGYSDAAKYFKKVLRR